MSADPTRYDREQLIDALSSDLDAPRLPSLITQILDAAKQVPGTCAVASAKYEMGYSELLSATDGLVEALAAAGVRPREVIAVQGGKTCGTIVAMLAVLKAGCAIAPLDPDIPLRRRLEMIHAARATTVLLTHRSWEYADEQYQVITVCPNTGQVQEAAKRRPFSEIGADQAFREDLAYVIFTSGTTGAPRGILGSGNGISHFVNWQKSKFNITSSDRISQLASLSFDASLREIFVALTSGATLVLPNFKLHQIDELNKWIDRCGVTIFHTVPSVGKAILSYAGYAGSSFKSVRKVFFVGEPLSDHLIVSWRSTFPECGDIVNMYGTSETTLAKTFFEVPTTPSPGIQPPGCPLPFAQCYVLDQDLAVCDANVDGDIYIRTPYRCLGLINDRSSPPAFVANPFSSDPDDLLHHTGDRGCYGDDGTLEITGRSDDEVKINGIRVNPQEAQAILQNHTDLKSCFVCTQKNSAGEHSLVAFIVCPDNAEIGQIRAWMANRVHRVFVPSRFVRVDSIPMTINGKVDAAKLVSALDSDTDGEPVSHDECPSRNPLAPVTPVEHFISRITCELLDVDRVDLAMGFFEVGGHSLLAVHTASRILSELNVELDLREFFEADSLQKVAALVEEKINSLASRTDGLELRRLPNAQDSQLPLSYPQERLWFMSRLDPETTAFVIPSAIKIHGPLDRSVFERSLQKVILRHDALRTTFVKGSPAQSISDTGECDYEFHDLIDMGKAERDAAMATAVNACLKRPFDVFNDRLLRVVLVSFSAAEHVMLYSMHHIISDGWSLSIFRRELFEIYHMLVDDTAPVPPPLEAGYTDYVCWQRQLIEDREQDYAAFWKGLLGSDPEPVALPLRRINDANVAGRLDVPFTPELSTQIKALSKITRTTVFVFLLAVLRVVLYRSTGDATSIIGCPVAGRNRVEFERIIGFFINVLPLRLNIHPGNTFRELLKEEKRLFYETCMFQEYPYAHIVSTVCKKKRMDGDPLIQVLLNYQHYPSWTPELFEIEEFPFETGRQAKFPIAFNIKGHKASRLTGVVEYNTSLLEENWIRGFVQEFVSTCKKFVFDPDAPIADLTGVRNFTERKVTSAVVESRSRRAARKPSGPSTPQDVVETEVSRIVQDVLNVREPDMNTGFFDLGGHSLLAVQLTSRICSHFDLELTIRSFFEAPSFRDVADEVKRLHEVANQYDRADSRLKLRKERDRAV